MTRRRRGVGAVAGTLLFYCSVVAHGGTGAIGYTAQNIIITGTTHVVRVPAGLQLELLTAELEEPRLLTFAANGDLFIGSKSGNVYRVPPPYTQPQVLIKLGGYPHSVALRNDEILIARIDGFCFARRTKPGRRRLRNRPSPCLRSCRAAVVIAVAALPLDRTGACT
jgi:hypothetical protein